MVAGTKDDAQALKEEIAGVLSTMGLRLSPEKTLITRIDEGPGFLGWRIQRHRKRGSSRQYACTYPSRKAVKAVTGKVKTICRTTDTNLPLDALLLRLNPALQGWCAYFRPGVSARAFSYPGYYTWQQAAAGCAANTTGPPGRTCAAGTARATHGGPPRRTGSCSARRTWERPATAIAEQPSRPPGRPRMRNTRPRATCGAPGAWKQARRVREAARGNGPVDETGTAPQADFTVGLCVPRTPSTALTSRVAL